MQTVLDMVAIRKHDPFFDTRWELRGKMRRRKMTPEERGKFLLGL